MREHFAKFLMGGRDGVAALAAWDALADTPFYSRASAFRRAYPNASFVCTTRSARSWVDSMIFGHLGAGGLYLPRLYGLRGPPYANTTEVRRNLTQLFHRHAIKECGAVHAAPLDLRDGPSELWRRLCAAVPRDFREGRPRALCDAKLAAEAPWPRTHLEVSRRPLDGDRVV